jgi:hypothetical protein
MKIVSTGQTFNMEARKKFEPHSYEVRTRSDRHGVYLISDRLPFGRLWYLKPDDAIRDAKFYSRSHDATIRVYDDAGKLIERTSTTAISNNREFFLRSMNRVYFAAGKTARCRSHQA